MHIFKLVQTLNEFLQHVSVVHVHHLQENTTLWHYAVPEDRTHVPKHVGETRLKFILI
jgi:hypothetical protein